MEYQLVGSFVMTVSVINRVISYITAKEGRNLLENSGWPDFTNPFLQVLELRLYS